MVYDIVREQLTPPGADRVLGRVACDSADLHNLLTCEAEAEVKKRSDVDHISLRDTEVTLIGQPAKTGNRYSRTSSMVRFVAKPVR